MLVSLEVWSSPILWNSWELSLRTCLSSDSTAFTLSEHFRVFASKIGMKSAKLSHSFRMSSKCLFKSSIFFSCCRILDCIWSIVLSCFTQRDSIKKEKYRNNKIFSWAADPGPPGGSVIQISSSSSLLDPSLCNILGRQELRCEPARRHCAMMKYSATTENFSLDTNWHQFNYIHAIGSFLVWYDLVLPLLWPQHMHRGFNN